MVYIRMLVDMQGGRYDGRPWPGYKGLIDVEGWEADHLTSGGTAEYADKPDLDRGWDVLRFADPNYEEHLKFADGGVVKASDEEEPTALSDSDLGDFDDDFESVDEEVTPQVKRPSTVDHKAAWIDWAVSKGESRENASAKTKAMLIAEY